MALRQAAITALALSMLLSPVVAGRDLPFAPPRPKKDADQYIFSPFDHEAVVVKAEPGWIMLNRFMQDKVLRLMQFGPPGSQLGDGENMINVVSYLSLPAKQTALDFVNRAKKDTEKMVPKGKYTWIDVSTEDPNDVTFICALKGWLDSPDQYEVERVIKGRDGMHAVIYHLSSPDAPQKDKEHALAWIKSVELKKRVVADDGERTSFVEDKQSVAAESQQPKPVAANATAPEKPAEAATTEEKKQLAGEPEQTQ